MTLPSLIGGHNLRGAYALRIRTDNAAIRPLDDPAGVAAEYGGGMLRRPRAPAAIAAVCVLATALVWALAFHAAPGARLDAAVLDGFTGFRDTRLARFADVAVALAGPLPIAAMTLAIAAVALGRRRPIHAVVAVVVVVAASATTELLKPLATVSRPAPAPQFAPTVDVWPSGHMTAAMAVVLCLVLVVPARLRPAAAILGGCFAVAEGYGVLVLGWHYPSDVAAACLIAAGWLALSVAAVGVVTDHSLAGLPRWRPVVWPAAAVAAAFAAGALLARPHRVIGLVEQNTTFVAAAAALGAAALGLVALAAMALTLSERRARPIAPRGRAPRIRN
jgi:membrane-associated phospholipid phosphatase